MKRLFIVIYCLFFFACKTGKKEIISEKEVNNIITKDLTPFMLKYYNDSIVYVCRNKLINPYSKVITPNKQSSSPLSKYSDNFTLQKWQIKDNSSLRFLEWNFNNPKMFFRKIPPKIYNDTLIPVPRKAFGISDYYHFKDKKVIVFMTEQLGIGFYCGTGIVKFHFFKKENGIWIKKHLSNKMILPQNLSF